MLVTAIACQAEALVGRLGPTPMSRCRQGAYGKLTRAQMFYFDTPAEAQFLTGRVAGPPNLTSGTGGG